MASNTIVVPEELTEELKRTASDTGLSLDDVVRRAMRLGLPLVNKTLSGEEDFSEAAADTWEKLGPAPTINYDKLEEG